MARVGVRWEQEFEETGVIEVEFGKKRNILAGDEGAQQRALYKSMGYTQDDLERPMIGVVNSWNTACPGQYNLRSVADAVKTGIYRAGGTAVEFGTIGPCDGVADGNDGMMYILPSRDIIAQSVEVMTMSHQLDGLVLLGGCDKIVPGMLMAAASLNLPAIFVASGPMMPGTFEGRDIDVNQIMIGLGAYHAGKLTRQQYEELEAEACPGPGSCTMMGTANTMCTVAEALGLSLPGSAAIPAVHAGRLRVAQESGKAIVELVKKGIRARDIITRDSVENAIRVAMAVGGSTNLFLHMLALTFHAGIDFEIDEFNRLSDTTPQVCALIPASDYDMIDYWAAGGVPAVMKELRDLLNLDCLTVTGKRVRDNLESAVNKNTDVIRPIEKAYSKTGGLAVVRGNLAPGSGITRPAVIAPECRRMRGPAKVFDSESELFAAISERKIQAGDIIVVRYEGPKGGPGMREMFVPLELLKGMGLERSTAVITDGRFSGSNSGCFIGHICPEAADGGPIAVVQNGDVIDIDIEKRTVNMEVESEEIQRRLQNWRRPSPRIKEGYLAFYSQVVGPASHGAVVGTRIAGIAG